MRTRSAQECWFWAGSFTVIVMLERPGGGANRNSSGTTAAVPARLPDAWSAWRMWPSVVVQDEAGVRPLWFVQSEPFQLGRVAWSAQIRPPASPSIWTVNRARYSAAWVSSLLLHAAALLSALSALLLAQRMILRRKTLFSPATATITGTG